MRGPMNTRCITVYLHAVYSTLIAQNKESTSMLRIFDNWLKDTDHTARSELFPLLQFLAFSSDATPLENISSAGQDRSTTRMIETVSRPE